MLWFTHGSARYNYTICKKISTPYFYGRENYSPTGGGVRGDRGEDPSIFMGVLVMP